MTDRHQVDRPDVPPTGHEDIVSAPGSERETEVLQDDQAGSPALQDPDIDRSAIKLLPGTGDYTDDGDVEVDPADLHIPTHPDRAAVAQGTDPGSDAAGDDDGATPAAD